MAKTTYTASAYWFNEAQVTLQVDFDVLTPELAAEINDFWSSSEHRLRDQDGDVQRAVIRMFGEVAIRHFMVDGGASFGPTTDVSFTEKVIQAQGEGWPDVEGLGILITAASVSTPEYEDVSLEVASAR